MVTSFAYKYPIYSGFSETVVKSMVTYISDIIYIISIYKDKKYIYILIVYI